MLGGEQIVLDSNVIAALIGIIGAGGIAVGAGIWKLASSVVRLEQSMKDFGVRLDSLEDSQVNSAARQGQILDRLPTRGNARRTP